MFHLGINSRALITPQTRGLSRHTFNLIKHLLLLAPDLKISLFSNMPLAKRFREEFAAFKNINFVESTIPSKNRWEFCHLPKLVLANKIDLFHSPINQGIPQLPKKIKSVLTLHDLFTHQDMKTNLLQGHLWTYLVYRYSLHHSLKANRIIAVSQYTNHSIQHAFPDLANRVDVVYNGADNSLPQQRMANLPSGRYIAYVGGFEARKNISFLIENYLIYYKNNLEKKPPYLLIAGPVHGASPILLEKMKNSSGIFFYANPSDQEVVSIFQHAHCTVHPSILEGFGLQLIESMKTQTPMLASDIPPFREIADGCCQFFDPYNGQSLINALQEISDNPTDHEKLRSKCSTMMDNFSWQKMASETLSIYTKLLEQ